MRIAHLADLHLGFRAYSRLNAKGVNQREADVFRAFREALTKIQELQVDAILMAGDIFHVPHPSNLTIIQTFRELAQFQHNFPVPIVMIAGNHESVRSSDNRCILELFSALPYTRVVSHNIEAVDLVELGIVVNCIPHNALPNLAEFVVRPQPEYQYNILMVHGTVDSDRINDYGGHDIPRSLLEKPWDYVACGHYHGFTDLGNNAFYAGAIERTSNNIWQEADEPKGFVEFNLETKKATFHPLTSPRPTVDLPTIDAKNLTPVEIDRKIYEHAESIDVTDKLVRQKIINFPKVFQAQINNRYIRQLQNRATHYLLELRSPAESTSSPKELGNRDGLQRTAEKFLDTYDLPAGIKRRDFIDRALTYLR